MITDWSRDSKGWAAEYARLIAARLDQPSTSDLDQARDLGRRLFDLGVPGDELGLLHMTCVERMQANPSGAARSGIARGSPALRRVDEDSPRAFRTAARSRNRSG